MIILWQYKLLNWDTFKFLLSWRSFYHRPSKSSLMIWKKSRFKIRKIMKDKKVIFED